MYLEEQSPPRRFTCEVLASMLADQSPLQHLNLTLKNKSDAGYLYMALQNLGLYENGNDFHLNPINSISWKLGFR